ncbi:hypothetical protein ABJI51_05100 [Amycolatopsis sp. NEAU-NG30]|uniref:Uncharacterized protein n=1 Tax=Amycolatopsis melonis TaxID=3156488 RepID=A0ABV0L807_9PSEU
MPATPYENLGLAPAGTCSTSYRYPGKATLQPFAPETQTFTATADHAVNMGFAVWTPPGQGFKDENTYQQIYNDTRTPADNPGMTTPDGAKSVAWSYHGSLLKNLRPGRPGGASAPARVVVMAIPCIADNLPADVTTAAVATYDIASAERPVRQPKPVTGYDPVQLSRAACQANT